MRAVQITSYEGPSAVRVVDLPEPAAGEHEVLIKVKAAGVSFPEVLQSRGKYQIQPPLPFVPGSEVAGEVVSAPPDSDLSEGERVAGFSLLGGFAELVVASADLVFRLPEGVSFLEGAAIPLNYLTAHFGLVLRGRLEQGESVLVHGAAGGVGTASIQVAKAFGAGRVTAVTSTDAKGAVAVAAGADDYVLVDGFKDAVLGRGGVDIVVDPVGGDRFIDSLRVLKRDGRLLVVGFTAGDIPTVKVNRLLLGNTSVVGVGWGAYVLDEPGYVRRQWDALVPHMLSGAVRPVIGGTYGLEDAASALREIDERHATGKILLTA
jgi:NADPH2:quinone reductase